MQCYGDACGIAMHVPGAADGEGDWRKSEAAMESGVWHPLINPWLP